MNIQEDIIPGESMAGIKIGATIADIKVELDKFVWDNQLKKNGLNKIGIPYLVSYELMDTVEIAVNLLFNKVCRISALSRYRGSYNGICVGFRIVEANKILNNRLRFNDDEDFYYIDDNGIAFFVNDYYNTKLEDQIIDEISIYDKELLTF